MKRFIPLLLVFIIQSVSLKAQWKASEGPFGGGVQCLFVDNNTLYACTSLGGIFTSADEGENWTSLTNDIKNVNFYCITRVGNRLLAGGTNGLYSTYNNGVSWQNLAFTAQGKTIYDAHAIGNIINVSVLNEGVYHSTDYGLTWVKNNASPFTSSAFKFLSRESDLLMIGTTGIYSSNNLGSTWNSLNPGLPDSLLTCGASNGSRIFVGTFLNGLYHSSNNGVTWERPTQPSAGKYIRSLSFVGNRLFASVDKELYYSDDFGQSWQSCYTGMSNDIVYGVAAIGTKLIAGASSTAIYKSSNNGTSWTVSHTGIMASLVRGLVQKNNYIFAVLPGAVMRSEDNGQTWVSKSTGLPQSNLNTITQSYGNLYVGTSGNGLYVSYNNGDTWVQRQSSLNNIVIAKLVSVDSILFAATNWGVYRSANLGATWNLVDLPGNTNSISAMEVKGDMVYVGDFGGYLYRSEDAGLTFELDDIRLTNAVNYATSICITDSVTCFATAQGDLYSSLNGGLTWQQDAIGLPGKPINVLVAYQQSILMGTNEGEVYVSNNKAVFWNKFTDNLGLKFVTCLLPLQDKMLAGGNGVWSRPLAQMPSAIAPQIKEKQWQLFPNPSQGLVQIQFGIDKFGSKEIIIFDMLGKVVFQGFTTEKVTELNLENLPKGVYHLKMGDANEMMVQTLILY